MQIKTRFIVIRNCRSVALGLENSDVRPGSNSSIRVKKLDCTAHRFTKKMSGFGILRHSKKLIPFNDWKRAL